MPHPLMVRLVPLPPGALMPPLTTAQLRLSTPGQTILHRSPADSRWGLQSRTHQSTGYCLPQGAESKWPTRGSASESSTAPHPLPRALRPPLRRPPPLTSPPPGISAAPRKGRPRISAGTAFRPAYATPTGTTGSESAPPTAHHPMIFPPKGRTFLRSRVAESGILPH